MDSRKKVVDCLWTGGSENKDEEERRLPVTTHQV